MKPDAIVLTGDTIQDYAVDDIAPNLRDLPAPPLGKVAILGNHDYGAGWSDVPNARLVERELQNLGFDVLRNRVTNFHGIQLAGIDDFWSPCCDIGHTMAGVDPEAAGLVLCHNPDACDLPGWHGYRGWILAGHTHGGQCKPPFLPPPFLPVANKRYTRGAFDLADGRHLYINVGLGYIRKARFLVRPEMTLFTLTNDESGA